MKKIIKIFTIYLIPIIFVISFFEYNLPTVKNSYNKKKEFFEKSISENTVLVLGNSHARSGIDPTFFDSKGFNLANGSQSLYYDCQLFSNYLQDMDNLEIVLICVDYFSLEYNLSKSPEYWRAFFYERVYRIPPESKNHYIDFKRFSWIELYGRKRSLTYALNLFKVDLAREMKKNGSDSPYPEGMFKDGKQRVDFHHSIMNEAHIPANMEYLEKIIEISLANGIIPIIITLPVFHAYSDNIDKKKYQIIQENIDKLCKKYKIQYYNYFYDKRFEIDDFGNADHMCSKGMEKLSRIINAEILKRNLVNSK